MAVFFGPRREGGEFIPAGKMLESLGDGSWRTIDVPAGKTQEEIEDIVGSMVDSIDGTPNTETLIIVSYDDVNGKLSFIVDDDLSLYDNTTSGFYDQTDTQSEIDTRVDKAFIDALDVDADTLDGLDSTDFASATHAHAIDDLTDVDTSATPPSDGDLLIWDTSQSLWVPSAPESGSHQHNLNQMGDVVLTTPADNELLAYDNASGDWINQTAAEAGVAADVHTHTESDIIDLDHYNSTDFDTDFATKTTDDLTEGSNLYHTSERVSDVVGGMVTGNTEFGVEVTYEDTDNTLDFSLKYNGFYNSTTSDDILTYQNTGQAGTSEFPARHDHSHKVNANVTPSSAAIGGANARGSSSHLARADHVHAVDDDLSLYDNTTSNFQNLTEVQGEIDTRVDKAFVDALNVDADTLDGLDSTDFASSAHTHAIDDLSDIVITTPADNEILAFDNASGNWVNQTPTEAGIAEVTHTHTESDITDLDHYTTSDFDADFATKSVDELNDVDTAATPPSDGDALVWDSTASQWAPAAVGGGGGGGSGHPHVDHIELSDGTEVKWQISLEADNSISFNYVGT